MEMEQVYQMYEYYDDTVEKLNQEQNPKEKQRLENKLSLLHLLIKDELEVEQRKGNISPKFLELRSKLDSISALYEYQNPVDIEKKEDKPSSLEEKEEEKKATSYSLESTKIVSKYTGEVIDISKMSRIDKIKTIYEQTGVKLSNEDPEIVKLCAKRCLEFIRSCNPNDYIKKYGDNWQEEVAKIYKVSYLTTAQKCIDNGLSAVDAKREKYDNEVRKIELLASEIKHLKDARAESIALYQSADQEEKPKSI